jgi:uncharacterized protein YjiS (DUF1127 family)
MLDRPKALFLTALNALSRCHDRWLQRQTLAELDAHLLNDIGISREAADRECAKPFWHSESREDRHSDASMWIETSRRVSAVVSGNITGDE